MRELNTIQKREKLNKVFAVDEKDNDGANHQYDIYPAKSFDENTEPLICIRSKFCAVARISPNQLS